MIVENRFTQKLKTNRTTAWLKYQKKRIVDFIFVVSVTAIHWAGAVPCVRFLDAICFCSGNMALYSFATRELAQHIDEKVVMDVGFKRPSASSNIIVSE